MVDHSIITIGNFDGVHIGHQAILRYARTLGQQGNARVIALTFDPHPMAVLRPGWTPRYLMSPASKARSLRDAGAENVEVMEPTHELLSRNPQQFLERVIEQYHPKAFVEGPDFRFGKDRTGDIRTLRSLGQQMGFEVHVVDRVEIALSDQLLAPVSSTLARWLLTQGRVADATRCLGQPYALGGDVVAGQKRGKGIGVPTANIDASTLKEYVLPAAGVYAGQAILPDGSTHVAAINVGAKPTFAEHEWAIEAHLLDFNGDLYSQRIDIQFLRWIRDQQPFPGVRSLSKQLGQDIEQIRRWHGLGLLGAASERQKAAG